MPFVSDLVKQNLQHFFQYLEFKPHYDYMTTSYSIEQETATHLKSVSVV